MRAVLILGVCLAFTAGNAVAAEFHLRETCRTDGAVVRLGDMADILAGDEAQQQSLAAIELFPSPAGAQKRAVSVRQIQDALALRGINLARHRFSGSSQVIVERVSEKAPAKRTRLTTAQSKAATQSVRAALLDYLKQQSPTEQPWEVTFELSDEQASAVLSSQEQLQVSGGIAPWVGLQQFSMLAASTRGQSTFSFQAQVLVRPSVVVAIRPIAIGARISPADVQLQTSQSDVVDQSFCQQLNDVLGQEALVAIPAGTVLKKSDLRPPLLVRRGELVTVIARSAGIHVTTRGKSRDDGAHGEVIEIEPLGSKARLLARVSGAQQVEVYARATTAE